MKINYRSDFTVEIRMTGEDGQPAAWPERFAGRLVTSGWCKPYRFSSSHRAVRTAEGIVVAVDNHELGQGRLTAELTLEWPDANYPDGYRRQVIAIPLDAELVAGTGDGGSYVLGECIPPYVVLTAYDIARRNGYEGTAEEYEQATRDLPSIVDGARGALDIAAEAKRLSQEAVDSVDAVNAAGADAQAQAEAARAAAELADNAAEEAGLAAVRANSAAERVPEHPADTHEANTWQMPQTFNVGFTASASASVNGSLTVSGEARLNGDLTVAGNIIQQGQSYIVHAEDVYTKQDLVVLREGAVSGIPAGSYAGFRAVKYNGRDDGYLVYDHEGARVGKEGDTEPLCTRDEAVNMVPNAPLVWDAQKKRAVTGEWPEPPQLPAFRYVEMEVTYEDDTTETFNVMVQA